MILQDFSSKKNPPFYLCSLSINEKETAILFRICQLPFSFL